MRSILGSSPTSRRCAGALHSGHAARARSDCAMQSLRGRVRGRGWSGRAVGRARGADGARRGVLEAVRAVRRTRRSLPPPGSPAKVVAAWKPRRGWLDYAQAAGGSGRVSGASAGSAERGGACMRAARRGARPCRLRASNERAAPHGALQLLAQAEESLLYRRHGRLPGLGARPAPLRPRRLLRVLRGPGTSTGPGIASNKFLIQ